jgi:hypothetical protein
MAAGNGIRTGTAAFSPALSAEFSRGLSAPFKAGLNSLLNPEVGPELAAGLMA